MMFWEEEEEVRCSSYASCLKVKAQDRLKAQAEHSQQMYRQSVLND
jgi:hypothetical protein